jgi:hypothetical protein
MKLDVFGRKLEVIKIDGHWVIYQIGEGKKTRSSDFIIPSDYTEAEAILFLEDMLHEACTPQNPKIKRLD